MQKSSRPRRNVLHWEFHVMDRSKSHSVAKGRALQPLQSLQSGISSLSLDEAFAAVNLAKLKLEAITEQQRAAASTVSSAKQLVEEAESRLSSASTTLCTFFHPSRSTPTQSPFLRSAFVSQWEWRKLICLPRNLRLSMQMWWSRNESETY